MVERFIRSCIESVYSQGLDEADFEVILVNDGTLDNSIEKIEDILAQHQNVTIINQENQGLSVARNNGMRLASGKYILHLDSDDLLIRNHLKSLLHIALESNADMVIYDFVKMNSAEIESLSTDSVLLNQGEPKLEQSNYLKGWDFFLHDFDNRGYVWRVLFNKRFIENSHLHFIPGITSQDIPFMVDSLLINGIVVKVPLISIIYRQRPDSIVYNPNKKRVMDLTVAMKDLWAKKKNNSYPIEIRRRLTDALYHIFNNFQWRIILNKDVYVERHDIIRDLRDAIPDLKFDNNIQQLFTTCLFRLMPYRFFEMRKLLNDIIWKYKKLRRFPEK